MSFRSNQHSKQSDFDAFPAEIIIMLVEKMTLHDAINFMQTDRRLNELTKNSKIWKRYGAENFEAFFNAIKKLDATARKVIINNSFTIQTYEQLKKLKDMQLSDVQLSQALNKVYPLFTDIGAFDKPNYTNNNYAPAIFRCIMSGAITFPQIETLIAKIREYNTSFIFSKDFYPLLESGRVTFQELMNSKDLLNYISEGPMNSDNKEKRFASFSNMLKNSNIGIVRLSELTFQKTDSYNRVKNLNENQGRLLSVLQPEYKDLYDAGKLTIDIAFKLLDSYHFDIITSIKNGKLNGDVASKLLNDGTINFFKASIQKLDKLNPAEASKFEAIWSDPKYKTEKDRMVALLQDYNKGGAFGLTWRRHFTDEVAKIIKHSTDPGDIFNRLATIKTDNHPNSSFDKIRSFIAVKHVENLTQQNLAEPKQEIKKKYR